MQLIPTLTADQMARLSSFAREFSPSQWVWISGYFAGLAQAGGAGLAPAQTQVVASSSAPEQALVLYGTETGNAKGLAKKVVEQFASRGFEARAVDMEAYKTRELKTEKHIIVITATHGEGDPPDPARPFFEFLSSKKAPKLNQAHFAVLGLGDTSYEFFCKAAHDMDAQLETLGAVRLLDRVDCDVDYEETAHAWIEQVVEAFSTRMEPASSPSLHVESPHAVVGELAHGSEDQPLHATLGERVLLNGRGSDKATYHIEVMLENDDPIHHPGDALGVVVENDVALVEEIVHALGFNSNGAAEKLRRECELTILTPKFIKAYGEAADAAELKALSAEGNRDALNAYINNRQIVDVVREYPVQGMAPDLFTGMLRPLKPRLYSIASSAEACPGEIHLTVAEVVYESPLAKRYGVASAYLNHRLEESAALRVYVEPNTRFRLPDDPQTPVIMIGAGTGVAPYRAFIQEREVRGQEGRSWLFFGDRRFRTDFLYQAEWQQYIKDGYLTRMDVAFSRDQERKMYVQHRLLEHGKEIFAWLEEGAILYVCGDAKHMAPDVHNALIRIVAEQGGHDEEAAREYVNALTADKRYKRDVY